jgi:hypothetical protein
MTFELLETDRKVDHIKSTLERMLDISGVTAQGLPVASCTLSTIESFNYALSYFSISELKRAPSLLLYFDATIPGYKGHPNPLSVRVQLSHSQENEFKEKYGAQFRLPGW